MTSSIEFASSSHATSASYSLTSSYAEFSGGTNTAQTASYVKIAKTASYIESDSIEMVGLNSQIQYNNEGTLAGAFNFVYSQSSGYVSIATSSYSEFLRYPGVLQE